MTCRSQGPCANYFFSTHTFYKKVIYAQCHYNKHLLTYINEIRTKSSIMKLELKSKNNDQKKDDVHDMFG